ncbi:MAG: hypothetical protein AVDCRST_MAG48-835 [uncultured Friedmanniella sp.]|uniref:Uncharacterized protein n=1 Tax=uncultured Friedmanniella sp. TaxID=335381 RepID=A0A6J4K480_9ACTN|nr:MAG: hypothetical protein AVDCRST_MAG48-835 [uncultured Friedmanniella sp.]
MRFTSSRVAASPAAVASPHARACAFGTSGSSFFGGLEPVTTRHATETSARAASVVDSAAPSTQTLLSTFSDTVVGSGAVVAGGVGALIGRSSRDGPVGRLGGGAGLTARAVAAASAVVRGQS